MTNVCHKPRLYLAGSRAIPAILKESRAAILGKDRNMALVLMWEFSRTFNYSVQPDADYGSELRIENVGDRLTLEVLESTLRDFERSWELNKPHYPPWWRWWSGTRGK